MNEDTPLIRAEGLAISYGRRLVLAEVSLALGRGEFWFFLGANGSGKTTLLRALLGLLPPQSGTLVRADELRGQQRIGFVPQTCELSPWLPTTVREFVLLGLVGLATTARERTARLGRALDRMGLSGLERADYHSLSGGQRQRALVARALVREPRLLVLDEPMNHLDPGAEESLLQDLVELQSGHGATLVLVTHDTAMAHRHATHIASFAGGRVTIEHPSAPGGIAPAAPAPAPEPGSGGTQGAR